MCRGGGVLTEFEHPIISVLSLQSGPVFFLFFSFLFLPFLSFLSFLFAAAAVVFVVVVVHGLLI